MGESTVSRARLEEWQERLGLLDWRISLHDCVPAGEMKDQNCAGCVDWQEVDKSARIEIIDPDDFGERVIPFDYEKTLVHELLHLKMSLIAETFGEDPLRERVAHQLIDDLARALVSAKRDGGGKHE